MKFKHIAVALAALLTLFPLYSCARGGFSSGGRGGYSSGRSYSSPSRSYSSPSSRSYSSRSYTTTRTYRSYSSPYVRGGMMYGGWGMGYGYSNGLITGLIIGDLMYPRGSAMYNGPGPYTNNALLLPNGQVVNQQGYVVGTYINGVYTPVANGPFVGQQVPADAGAQQAQPIVIQDNSDHTAAIAFFFVIGVMCIIILGAILL